MSHEVGAIAHSCGVKSPRELKRYHARIVAPNGLSIPLKTSCMQMPEAGAKSLSILK